MLNFKNIETEIKDKQITIWLNQPATRNALNILLVEELIKAFNWADAQKDIMVILLRGKGRSFCAGADINWMIRSGSLDYQNCYRDSQILAECFQTIYLSDKVVINLVHGDVYGGGLGFLAAGDFTFADKGTRFCLPELRLGLIPSVIMPYLLTKVKPSDIKYHTFSTGIFSAEEALNKGYIEFICSNIDALESDSTELIKKIYSTSPSALVEAKNLIRDLNQSLINSDNIMNTVRTFTRLKLTDDSKERMSGILKGNKIKTKPEIN